MGPRSTRSKGVAAPAVTEIGLAPQLIRNADERHALLVLPRNACADARIVSLMNPVTASLTRYYFCPRLGLHEFTKIGHQRNNSRSCMITRANDSAAESGFEDSSPSSLDKGYILEDARILVATPIDLIFFLTPLLFGSEAYYRPADDYLDQLAEICPQITALLRCSTFRAALLDRLSAMSAMQDIGSGEVVYKPQLSFLLDTLIAKTTVVEQGSWPASMEESLVTKTLEVSMITSVIPLVQISDVPLSGGAEIETPEFGDITQAVGDASAHAVPLEIKRLMRRRVAFDFILSSYIPPILRSRLETLFHTKMQNTFAPLEKHLAMVQQSKAQALALRALSDNISRKRSAFDDDEAADSRMEKKRKKEEEERRKKAETRATKELKKVDTSGMKKLSSFFTRSAAVKVEK